MPYTPPTLTHTQAHVLRYLTGQPNFLVGLAGTHLLALARVCGGTGPACKALTPLLRAKLVAHVVHTGYRPGGPLHSWYGITKRGRAALAAYHATVGKRRSNPGPTSLG